MLIGIDARELSKPQPGGFRSSLRRMIQGLAEVDSENDYVIYLDRPMDLETVRFPARTRLSVVSGHRLLVDRFALPRAIMSDAPDVMHFPCNYGLTGLGIPTVITLLDCILLDRGHWSRSPKSRLLNAYFAHMIRRSIHSANAVITISNYVRDQIPRYLPGVADLVKVIHCGGPNIASFDGINEGCLSGVQAGNYALMIASSDPRKNVTNAIEGFSRSRSATEGADLVIVASHSDAVALVKPKLEECGLASRALVLTKVDDPLLAYLYTNAKAFVFASLDEGFGFPPLEAMACGCPVVSSQASVMPEVLGDAPVYFDPLNTDDIAGKIDMVWSDAALRDVMRERGRGRLELYAWTENARQTLEVYREATRCR